MCASRRARPGRKDDVTMTADDRLEIQELYSRWCVLLDTGQAEAWARLFTADGVFVFEALEVRASGFEELWAFAADVHQRERGLTRHYMHNVLIDPYAGGARGRADIELLDLRAGGDARIVKTAHYEDRLQQTDRGWCFVERHLYWDTPEAPADIGTKQWDQS